MPGADADFNLQQLRIDESRRYFLHVGGNQLYKNRLGLLRIWKELLPRIPECQRLLIMAGKPFSGSLRAEAERLNLGESILELTGATNEQLHALYSRAEGLIFPSLYEGFGLPIIEAQACGCPVFTSAREPMSVVAGPGACLFDPTKPEEAAETIARELPCATELRKAGLQNAASYPLSGMIDQYVELYRQIAG